MKKYLLLIALLATQILCANGFDNLKALQDRMPALVAQVNEDLGGPRLAPEVPYIAGLLEIRHSPAAAVVGDEATYIYDVLRTASNPHSKAVFEPHGLDREKKAALNQFDYTVFRYDRYLRSGHTVFGIAAQEHPPVIQKIVIERIISGNPVAISAVSAPAGGGGMGGGLFAGGVPAFKKKDANAVKPAATSPAVAKPAPKSLLVRVQEYKAKIASSTKANDIADVAILTELENELAKGAIVRNDDEAERYNSLVEFFGYLENPPSAPATQARVGKLRMDLKPKATVASPPPTINVASASPAVVSSGGGLQAVIASAMSARSTAMKNDNSDDDSDDEKIDLKKIDVSRLSIHQLKKQRKELSDALDEEDEFEDKREIPSSYAGRLLVKLQEVEARIDELEPKAKPAPKSLLTAAAAKVEVYLDDAEIDAAKINSTQKALYQGWRDKKEKTPEAARTALNKFPPKYEGEAYDPNPKKAAAVPGGGGGRSRRDSVAGGGTLSREEKAARKVEIETRIAEIETGMALGNITTMKGNREIAELRQELSKLG